VTRFLSGLVAALVFSVSVTAAEPPFWPAELAQLAAPISAKRSQPAEFFQWQQQQRQRLRQSYLWPEPLMPLKAERLSRSDQGQYWREHWQLQLLTPVWQRVWLLIPKTANSSAPQPAVLLLHDHGAEFRLGKDKWIRPSDPDRLPLAQRWADKYFSGHFVGETLAAQGFVVLAADTLGFGERGPVGYGQQQQLAANFLARGRSLAGFSAVEDLQLAAFLAAQPMVNKRQISALGFSMGAYRTWQLAALSEHISAAVGIGWFNQFSKLTLADGNLSKGQSSFYLLHPGLLAELDLPDIAALAAPKPLLLVMGGEDPLMPSEGVHQGFKQLQLYYQQCSSAALAQLELKFWPEKGHLFDAEMQQQVLHWLRHPPAAVRCGSNRP